MHKKTFKKYIDILLNGTISEQDLIKLRSHLGFNNGTNHENKVYIDIIGKLFGRQLPLKITKQHSDKGINYLRKVAFKKNGEKRNTKDYPFGEHELNIIRNFKKFELVNLFDNTNSTCVFSSYQPVFRVFDKENNYFDYIAYSFGQIEIIG